MALSTFPWDEVGEANEMEIEEISHVIDHPYGGGYSASRPAATKMQKAILTKWEAMTTAQWLALVGFWRSVYGPANAFYLHFPFELYGSPGYGGYGGLEPDDGFDADQDVGFGSGPVFTVKFVGNRLPQKYRTRFPGRWQVEATFREVA
jgi:hypothetical protein